MSRPASRQASEASVPSRPGSRDMLREASLSRPSTSHSTYSIGAATRGALSPIVSEGALSPDRVDVNDGGGVFKLTRPALPPSSLPQLAKPRRKKSARSSRSSGSSRSSRRSSRGLAPAPRILERQAAFADGEWENELARSILILYGSAMGSGKEIAGQENDFAVDNDAVKALGSKVTQDEIDAGKQREAASRERREKKKKRPKRIRKPPWESPPDSVVEFERSQASKAASSKPSVSADPNAKPLRPVWYLGTGPVQSEWDCLPEGDDMRLDLQALDEAGKYVEYLSCVEASLNAYVRRRCDGEGEQGRLFGRLWRQLCVTACVFVSRAVDQRRPALAMKLLDRAKQYSVASAAHVQVKADARELQAFVEDAYAYYYYCRGKYHAALHCVVKAMKIHVRQEEHAHVAKCHVHSACILSRLRRRPEAVRCLGQVLFLIESEKLDMCGDQPHLICLVAIAHHNMAVEQQGLGHFEEAVVSAQNARRLARLCLSYSNRWLEAFENTHRTCAESLTAKGDVNELEKQGGDVLAALNASHGSDRTSLNGSRASSRALRRRASASRSGVSRLTPEPAAPASRLGLGRVSQESSLATGSVVTGPG